MKGTHEMKTHSDFTCPDCGTMLEADERKSFFSRDTYTCPECHRTFTVKYNVLLSFAELYLLLKLLEAVSGFIVGKMTFVNDKEPVIFLVEIVLAFIISRFRPGILQKLKIAKLAEIQEPRNQ